MNFVTSLPKFKIVYEFDEYTDRIQPLEVKYGGVAESQHGYNKAIANTSLP